MRLYERCAVECAHLIPSSAPDGEGGYTLSWGRGGTFRAAIALPKSTDGREGERDALAVSVSVYTAEALEYGEAFEADGKAYRVVSRVDSPPPAATLGFRVYTAEEWRPPDE